MSYCLVENDTVTDGPRGLPRNWKNVSGLNLASDALLKEKGWLPYTEESVTLSDYEVRDGLTFTINTDGVVGTQKKRDMTADEKTSYDAAAAKKYQDDRKVKYDQLNQFEMQFDDQRDGTTTWVDAINAIKVEYPKP